MAGDARLDRDGTEIRGLAAVGPRRPAFHGRAVRVLAGARPPRAVAVGTVVGVRVGAGEGVGVVTGPGEGVAGGVSAPGGSRTPRM